MSLNEILCDHAGHVGCGFRTLIALRDADGAEIYAVFRTLPIGNPAMIMTTSVLADALAAVVEAATP